MGKYPIIYDLNKLIFIIQLLQALLIMYTIFIITLTTAINNNVVITKFPFIKNIEDITQKRWPLNSSQNDKKKYCASLQKSINNNCLSHSKQEDDPEPT